jgi:hypothetical protein
MKSQACIIGETPDNVGTVKRMVRDHASEITNVRSYSDYRTLLYDLHVSPNRYKMVMIRKNGSTTKPHMIGMFIQQIDPDIEVVEYDSPQSLSNQFSVV